MRVIPESAVCIHFDIYVFIEKNSQFNKNISDKSYHQTFIDCNIRLFGCCLKLNISAIVMTRVN